MEVFLYNSTVCRLCGEENDNGTLLYTCEENIQSLSEVINSYLPLKVTDDGELPRTICPGCTIQLEATVEFLNLIINGQKVIRELHQREKEYKKNLYSQVLEESVITDNIVGEIDTSTGIYQVEHPVALQVAGLDRPKRKRGRPPKKPKSPEQLAEEAAIREQQQISKHKVESDDLSGKRKRKTPTRFIGVVQGKELEKMFQEEGVTDEEESNTSVKNQTEAVARPPVVKETEIIGHKEDSGELVVVVKGKGRGRPKGRMRPTRELCNICGMEFSCIGRYMSHVAQHGPVSYQCGQCEQTYATRLLFNMHQSDTSHTGQKIIPAVKGDSMGTVVKHESTLVSQKPEAVDGSDKPVDDSLQTGSLPDLNSLPLETVPEGNAPTPTAHEDPLIITTDDTNPSLITESVVTEDDGTGSLLVATQTIEVTEEVNEEPIPAKRKLKCNYCDKLFSSKQAKSLHTKASHYGERPYVCVECGASFGYPRSLALHKLSHRRARNPAHGYACDLCGKVLNHPSSVVYHKEAEHAGQRYVCIKCNKSFKHKQLLTRHQLVHTQIRPFSCKLCTATFKTKPSLLNHQLLHTGIKKYHCDICNEKFAHKTSHTLHMRWHTGVKPYSCKICGKRFSQKGNLSEHERIHTGEKPYQCALCPRRFTTSSQHRLHARRHFAERPYACDTCPKRFASRGGRAAHERREAGAGAGAGAGCRQHRCGECSRGFAERWALVKHMRRHTGDRPYRCPHCPRAFADCSNLNKHKKQVHKQMSLLSNDNQPEWAGAEAEAVVVAEAAGAGAEERVIYVACDVDDAGEPDFSLIDSHQELVEMQPEPELKAIAAPESDVIQSVIVNARNQIPVTDEQGNPLHFTMQDGTRLAITSSDGKSLQVITHDGQTIPVEINGYAEEEEVHNPDTIVHHLDLQKTIDTDVTSPVTHFFAIV